MRLASAMIILPLILRLLPDQEVGLWNVMIGLNAMIYLLDFGFFQTFSRSVTYIFSGARELRGEGLGTAHEDGKIDYSLLKGALSAMRVYYAGVAIFLVILLFTGGYFYIEKLLEGYSGDAENARLAWYLYGILLSYQFYTYYYDALLVGRGMIKRSRQIIVFSQCTHIVLASAMLIMGFGIISMVCGQTLATILNRMLSRRAFYDKETKAEVRNAQPSSWIIILKTLWKTAYKSGLANLSLVFTNKMLTLIGGLFIPLAVLGSYGITKQLADLTYTLSLIWFMTFLPKLTQNRLLGRECEVKRIYIKAQYIALGVFAALSVVVVTLGPWALRIIKSNTPLLESDLLVILFAASLFEAFTFLSTSVLVSKNTVPHYKAQMVTAVATIVILLIVLNYTEAGVIALIVVPLSVQLIYQHWKWTCVVLSDLKVRLADYDPRKYLKF
jgi:O-antigen/teichoic acid export membrane protein